ncbi:MAG: metallophosphoesterase [Candidatus Helarchaeota archaeon]
MKYQEFIQEFKQFDNKDSNLINKLIEEVKEIVVHDPILIEIKNGARSIFVGDIHGDYKTLELIIRIFLDEDFNYIFFLGDYVDRGFGDMQIKTMNVLLSLKKKFPKKVYLLRGNHEWRYINAEYGFKEAIYNHLNMFLYYRYNELFDELPIAVKISSPRLLGVHGGIPISEKEIPYTLEDIANVPKKTCFDNKIAQQILWNDPSEKVEKTKMNYRGLGYIFGFKPFKKFMKYNNLEFCIRSHELMKNGNGFCFNNKLITIFSSRSYSKKTRPHILIINQNKKIEFREILKC